MFKKGKTCIITKLHRTDLVICSHSREGKPPPYSRINMVQHIENSKVSEKLDKQSDQSVSISASAISVGHEPAKKLTQMHELNTVCLCKNDEAD